METYTYSVSSSSSSSYSNSPSSPAQFPSQEERNRKLPPAYRSALHSVRRNPAKNVITKKPIAPMPPTPPKIYKVDRFKFREVVQRLTAAPEFQRTRLQEVAPLPLSMPMSGKATFDSLSSPSTLAWCSSIVLSPGTLAVI